MNHSLTNGKPKRSEYMVIGELVQDKRGMYGSQELTVTFPDDYGGFANPLETVYFKFHTQVVYVKKC